MDDLIDATLRHEEARALLPKHAVGYERHQVQRNRHQLQNNPVLGEERKVKRGEHHAAGVRNAHHTRHFGLAVLRQRLLKHDEANRHAPRDANAKNEHQHIEQVQAAIEQHEYPGHELQAHKEQE